MGTEKDISDLQKTISELIKIVHLGQIEMIALQGVLVEHHDLSSELLTEYRDLVKKRSEMLHEELEPATPHTQLERLRRFQGPPQ